VLCTRYTPAAAVTYDFKLLAIIGALAVLAPLIADIPARLRMPVVVAEIGLGMVDEPVIEGEY
jgi:Kef-type K+ transport system membrane component KefB